MDDGSQFDGALWTDVGDSLLAETIRLRRAIHEEPELGLHLPRTAAKIRAELEGLPLEILEGPSTSGLMAILRGSANGRTVLLRGDMDALPLKEDTGLAYGSRIEGAMHACGHDTHVAMLVGAAKALCAERERLAGTVMFMFQPGEEGWHGARYMMEDGLLDAPKPDAAFALHISPNMPCGAACSAAGMAPCWPRPTRWRYASRAGVATRRCRTTRLIRCRSPARSSWRCRASSRGGSRCSIPPS